MMIVQRLCRAAMNPTKWSPNRRVSGNDLQTSAAPKQALSPKK